MQSKAQVIDGILQINPSARQEWLDLFEVSALRRYLDHLQFALEPRGPDTTVARFLDRRGPGLHHIAYRVPDIREALEKFAQEGYRLIDSEPRPGAGGHKVAFLHPTSTGGVLIELVER